MSAARQLGALGLVVPCRNEAGVIERKLRNLSALEWPAADRPHRIVVVDDGSEDGTAALASSALEGLVFPAEVRVELMGNELRPGKPGAVQSGLVRLAGLTDFVGVTDADVLLERTAVCRLLEAFETEPELAMACAEQVFVESLPPDGLVAGASVPRGAETYDRWTAWWRRCESRFGALFSVHGQFLVWKSELELAPRFGLAADDLDLMLQVRAKRPRARIELATGSRFYEVKPSANEQSDAQALRRARAYVQLVRSRTGLAHQPLARSLQWRAYRTLPLAAPALSLAVLFAAHLLAVAFFGAPGLFLALALSCLLALSKHGRSWVRIMRLIVRALRHESESTLPEQWEMARPR